MKLKNKASISDSVLIDVGNVIHRAAYRALSGDASINIPSVPGVGEKRATSLLSKYGDASQILQAVKGDKLTGPTDKALSNPGSLRSLDLSGEFMRLRIDANWESL